MSFTPPAVADFKAQFYRDFPFVPADGDQSDTGRYVVDLDVANAITKAGISFTPDWDSQAIYTLVYNLRAAHFLCVAIAGSMQGLRGRGGEWAQMSRSVGNVSASFSLPERFTNSAMYAPFLQTTYGCEFLTLLAPKLVGGAFGVVGFSKP